MADTDETPLLATDAAGRPAPLSWPHYLGIALLLAYVVSAVYHSLSSLWTLLAGLLLLICLAHGAHKFYTKHAPRTSLTPRFVVSQTALGVFVAPLAAALVAVGTIFALLLPTLLAIFLVIAAFSAKYPQAMEAFAEAVNETGARATLAKHATREGVARVARIASALPSTAIRAVAHADNFHPHKHQHHHPFAHGHHDGAFGGPDAPAVLWKRMVDAGATPIDLGAVIFVLALILIAFTVCAVVTINAAREFARWKLFKRFPVLSSDADADADADANARDVAAARALGVRGVVLAAMIGAFGMAFTGALSELMRVSTPSKLDEEFGIYLPTYVPSLYAAIVFLPNALLDVAVFVGSMLYVGTAYAEKTVLDDTSVDMRKAWTTSVVYNLALGAIRVGTPGPGTPVSPPLLVFLLITLVRTAVMFKFSKKARARFVAACAAEDLSSAQQPQQAEEA